MNEKRLSPMFPAIDSNWSGPVFKVVLILIVPEWRLSPP